MSGLPPRFMFRYGLNAGGGLYGKPGWAYAEAEAPSASAKAAAHLHALIPCLLAATQEPAFSKSARRPGQDQPIVSETPELTVAKNPGPQPGFSNLGGLPRGPVAP